VARRETALADRPQPGHLAAAARLRKRAARREGIFLVMVDLQMAPYPAPVRLV
jgi:hypothetical protein